MWFIAVEVEQETSAPPPKKNPGFAPVLTSQILPVAMTTQSNKPFLPETNCCYAFPGVKIFYSMYIF